MSLPKHVKVRRPRMGFSALVAAIALFVPAATASAASAADDIPPVEVAETDVVEEAPEPLPDLAPVPLVEEVIAPEVIPTDEANQVPAPAPESVPEPDLAPAPEQATELALAAPMARTMTVQTPAPMVWVCKVVRNAGAYVLKAGKQPIEVSANALGPDVNPVPGAPFSDAQPSFVVASDDRALCEAGLPPVQFMTVLWAVVDTDGNGDDWEQNLVGNVVTSTPSLNALDALMTQTDCIRYQADVYYYTLAADKADVDALIAGGVLNGPSNPVTELLIPGGASVAWKLVGTNGTCTPPDVCPADFEQEQIWEVTWGHGFIDRNSDEPTFTVMSNGGLTSFNGGPVPEYMTGSDEGATWHWLYVDKPATDHVVTYGFADGTVRTATITGDQNGCPTITWTETPPPPELIDTINQPGSEPPTCTENGHRVDAEPQEGVTIVWTDEQEVIGENPWTAVFDPGFVPADGLLTSGSVVVEAMLPSLGPTCLVMVEVQPLDVTQMVCTASDDGLSQRFSEASIEAPETDGLTYSIEGGEWTGLEPGTYTVSATPDQYRPIDAESLPEGWTLNQDGTATIDVTIDQAANCINPFTEKEPTSASTTTCDAVTTVTVMWERKWTIVNNVLVPGDWTEVSRTTDKRDLTAAEIAAKRLVCTTTPTPPVLASTGFNAANLGLMAVLAAFAGWVLLFLRRRLAA